MTSAFSDSRIIIIIDCQESVIRVRNLKDKDTGSVRSLSLEGVLLKLSTDLESVKIVCISGYQGIVVLGRLQKVAPT